MATGTGEGNRDEEGCRTRTSRCGQRTGLGERREAERNGSQGEVERGEPHTQT